MNSGVLSVLLLSVALGGYGVAPELVVHAPPELAVEAEQVRAYEFIDFSSVLAITGQVGFRAPVTVVLVPEESELARDTPSWISGFARGERGVIVLFPARVRSYPDRNMVQLFTHELAHVMVARAARGRSVPRWFNEGVATVAAREWSLEDRARYAMAVVGARPKRVRDLDRGFAGSAAEVRRSYALASAFVRFLQRERGAAAPAAILAEVAVGADFETAFRRATGMSLRRAERRFFEREAFLHTWLPFLTSSAALWMAITSLALVAIYRRRQRSARLRETWDELEPPLPRPRPTPGLWVVSDSGDEPEDHDDEIVN